MHPKIVGSTFVLTRDLPYIASINFYFIYARKIYVRMHVKITQQWINL